MPKLTYANVTSTLALFLALGGASYAAISVGSAEIRNNSVRSQDLRNNEIRSKDIRNRTIVGRDVLTNAIGGLQINENTLGRVPDATRLEGRAASSFTVACPAGTIGHAGACFETTARSAQTFAAASRTCGVADRRLPLLSELESYRQEAAVTLAGDEWTANVIDGNHVLTITDAGVHAAPPDSASKQFRCVAPLTN
jgi:hypothetical protein